MNDNENKTNAPTIKLLPCPFCGDDEIMRYNYEPDKWRITCRDCRNTTKDWPTLDEAAEHWNTRNEADALRAEVEGLKRELADSRENHIDANQRNAKACEETDRLVAVFKRNIATLKEYAAIKPNAAAGEEKQNAN